MTIISIKEREPQDQEIYVGSCKNFKSHLTDFKFNIIKISLILDKNLEKFIQNVVGSLFYIDDKDNYVNQRYI